MSQDNSIFNDAGATTPPDSSSTEAGTQPQVNNDQLGTLLSGIKNERGEQKYKSVEDALKALNHSQNFIPQLQGQLEAKEAALLAAQSKDADIAALQETVAKLTQKITEAPTTQGQPVDEDAIAEIVGRQLQREQAAKKQQDNLGIVTGALGKQFGDKAADVFYGKAQELGMTREQINELAASSPQAVLTMFGVNGGASLKKANNPPYGSVNTAGFSGNAGKSFIGRETTQLSMGASHRESAVLLENAKRMAQELQENGMSVHDLTDPTTFFKYFGK